MSIVNAQRTGLKEKWGFQGCPLMYLYQPVTKIFLAEVSPHF